LFPDLKEYGREWPLNESFPHDSWTVEHWIRIDAHEQMQYMVDWLKKYINDNPKCEPIHRMMVFRPASENGKYGYLGLRMRVWFKDEIVTDPAEDLQTKKN